MCVFPMHIGINRSPSNRAIFKIIVFLKYIRIAIIFKDLKINALFKLLIISSVIKLLTIVITSVCELMVITFGIKPNKTRS